MNNADIHHFQHHRKFYWTVLLQWTEKRPPYHLATVHPPFLPTYEASARLCATSTRLLPFHSFVLERTFPLPGPQTPYLSLSTFKAGPNASSSMKLSLNPHLALVLAESVAPMACVCISITALIPLDYKSLCVICLLRKITSSFRTGIRLLTWGFPMPGDNKQTAAKSGRFSKCFLNSAEWIYGSSRYWFSTIAHFSV